MQHQGSSEGTRDRVGARATGRVTQYTDPGHTPTYSYSGCVCETLHEYILAYPMLIQQASHTGACTQTVANRAGNQKIRSQHSRGKKRKRGKNSPSSWRFSSCFLGLVFGIQAIQNPHGGLHISIHDGCGHTKQKQPNQRGTVSNLWNRNGLQLPKRIFHLSPFITR